MLVAKAKPLNRARIEKVIRTLGYNEYTGIVTPLIGARGSFIVSCGHGMEDTSTWLVAPSGKVSIVTHQDSLEAGGVWWPSLANAAQIKGKTLLLGGLIGWSGNGPRYALETYRREGRNWSRTSRAQTEYECWGAEIPASLVSGGAIQLRSRTYGKSVECCHATALVSIGEAFRVRQGIVKRVGERRLDTAFNTLDSLAGALASGNHRAIGRIVPSKSLRRRLAKIWPRFGPEPRVEVANGDARRENGTYGWSRDGSSETLWLSFARRSRGWVVTKIS